METMHISRDPILQSLVGYPINQKLPRPMKKYIMFYGKIALEGGYGLQSMRVNTESVTKYFDAGENEWDVFRCTKNIQIEPDYSEPELRPQQLTKTFLICSSLILVSIGLLCFEQFFKNNRRFKRMSKKLKRTFNSRLDNLGN